MGHRTVETLKIFKGSPTRIVLREGVEAKTTIDVAPLTYIEVGADGIPVSVVTWKDVVFDDLQFRIRQSIENIGHGC